MGAWASVDLMEEWAWVALVVHTEGWVVMEALVGPLVGDLDEDMVGASEEDMVDASEEDMEDVSEALEDMVA